MSFQFILTSEKLSTALYPWSKSMCDSPRIHCQNCPHQHPGMEGSWVSWVQGIVTVATVVRTKTQAHNDYRDLGWVCDERYLVPRRGTGRWSRSTFGNVEGRYPNEARSQSNQKILRMRD